MQAGLGDLRDGALITLLALNGVWISEALNADIDDFSTERGHRTLAIVGKAVGPIFLGVEGGRMDRYCADRMVKRFGEASGDRHAHLAAQSAARVHHRRFHSTPASRCGTCKKLPLTLIRARRCATTGHGAASTGMPPTSCRRSSPEQPDPPEDAPRNCERYWAVHGREKVSAGGHEKSPLVASGSPRFLAEASTPSVPRPVTVAVSANTEHRPRDCSMITVRERMNILSAYREVGSYRAAADICGTTHKTVKRAVLAEAAKQAPAVEVVAHNYDDVRDLVAERVDKTRGRITAKRLLPVAVAAGYDGSDRNFRRLVAAEKRKWRQSNHRGRRARGVVTGRHAGHRLG